MMKSCIVFLAAALTAGLAASPAALAKWPPDRRVSRDVKTYWEKTWPDQEVAYVKKTTDCTRTEIEQKTKSGKVRKRRACVVKVDVYVARGYRYFIYRDSSAIYMRRRLHEVERGELQKAWKEGGVPAPAQEEAAALLEQLARDKLGASAVEIRIDEMGKPRPCGDFYRLTLVVDLAYTRDGESREKEQVYATLRSDGTGWEPIPELAF